MKSQFIANITFDTADSVGKENTKINLSTIRPMAFSLKNNGLWYGFVITRFDADHLTPGEKSQIEMTFLNSHEAELAFPLNSSILFGDGEVSKGVIILTGRAD